MSSSPRSFNAKYTTEKSSAVVESVLPTDHDADAQKLVEMGKSHSIPARLSSYAKRDVQATNPN
ncbi:hypothetical protein FS749_008509 [Ceratobasidium sp. UAMH 11750]|nr:hypothetical protein FS749_008509 [Ceratobasidium sp. UAMH 11750]